MYYVVMDRPIQKELGKGNPTARLLELRGTDGQKMRALSVPVVSHVRPGDLDEKIRSLPFTESTNGLGNNGVEKLWRTPSLIGYFFGRVKYPSPSGLGEAIYPGADILFGEFGQPGDPSTIAGFHLEAFGSFQTPPEKPLMRVSWGGIAFDTSNLMVIRGDREGHPYNQEQAVATAVRHHVESVVIIPEGTSRLISEASQPGATPDDRQVLIFWVDPVKKVFAAIPKACYPETQGYTPGTMFPVRIHKGSSILSVASVGRTRMLK